MNRAMVNPFILLEQGRYSELVESFDGPSPLPSADASLLIGALAFLGRIEEALEVWRLHHTRLTVDEQVRARFFLGVTLTRTSRIAEGFTYFAQNQVEADISLSSQAYVHQGTGFYAYFTGRFAEAKQEATIAMQAGIASGNTYVRFLATDLLGHGTVQLGRRSEGLRLIRLAKDLALAHGNRNFASAFHSAIIVYEAEAGWRPNSIVQELESTLATLESRDSYTRGNLVLELARQWTLRGRWSHARDFLNRESSSIYAFGNRRQELTLQLRLAEAAFRQGDKFSADHFVRSARRCLHDIADRAFEIRVLGMEVKLGDTRANDRLLQILDANSSLMNRQILFRQGFGVDPDVSESEDPLHQIFLLRKTAPTLCERKVLETGYLGLWPALRGLPAGEESLTVLEDGTSIVMTDQTGVTYRPQGLSRQNLQLLRELLRGVTDKAGLIQNIWGYAYDPLRHDSLVYSALTNLRHTLEPHSAWIRTTENGWQLAPSVRWNLPTLAIEKSAMLTLPAERGGRASTLNFRQIRAIEALAHVEAWAVQSYSERFSVSLMTAFRDLDDLRRRGTLVRTGRGRSTTYHDSRSPI